MANRAKYIRVVTSRIATYYQGTLDSCPFDKTEVLSFEPIQWCEKGAQRE